LQCVAACRSVLQCVAVCCSVLQCVAACCSVLQCVAVCCSVCWGTRYPSILCKFWEFNFRSPRISGVFSNESQTPLKNEYKLQVRMSHELHVSSMGKQGKDSSLSGKESSLSLVSIKKTYSKNETRERLDSFPERLDSFPRFHSDLTWSPWLISWNEGKTRFFSWRLDSF